MALIPMFKSIFYTEEVLLNDVIKFQRNLVSPTLRPDIRDIIYKRLDEKDLSRSLKRF